MKKLSLPTSLTLAVVLSGVAAGQSKRAPVSAPVIGAATTTRAPLAPAAQGQNLREPMQAHDEGTNQVIEHYHRQLRRQAGQNSQAPRPMIGVRIAPVDDAVSAQLPPNLMPALRLTSIFPNSPAERAGLEPNDVVTAIDGDTNVTVESLIAAISSKEPGSTVRLDVSRAGTTRVFNVAVELLEPEEEHDLRSRLNFEFSQNSPAAAPWPRFGMRHDGRIMMQQQEGSDWTETEVESPALEHWRQSRERVVEGSPYVDLSRPDVDPGGDLRRQLEHLHEAYRERAQGEHQVRIDTQRLEHRIERLEQKVDDIHRMLSELVSRRK